MQGHEEFLARGQKDERSRLESLLELFQKQGKLPADNMKAKGITKKLFNLTSCYQWRKTQDFPA